MVIERSVTPESIHRGNLLKISGFLWSFASDYAIRNGPVTPKDIDDAFEYAHRNLSHKYLEELYHQWQRDLCDDEEKMASINQHKEWENLLGESKCSLDKMSERTKQTYAILQRFEVWSTMILAKKYLLPIGASVETDAVEIYPPCWSSLLNIPGACHFAKILPELPSTDQPNDEHAINNGEPTSGSTGDAENPYDDKCSNSHAHDSPCSLALPPNTLTSHEYARLARMLYLLPDDHSRWQVARTPLTWLQKEGAGLADSFKFTVPDLMALWIRGQRNTFALRHLWQIFSFSFEDRKRSLTIRGTNGSGKCLVPVEDDEQDEEHNIPRKFVAKMIGNSRKTRTRVLHESSHVDDLVTWAVINQAIFTFHHVRAVMKSRLTLRKRRLKGLYQSSQKRRRVEQNEDLDQEDLRSACQSYVLRWFARRHLEMLAVLFLPDPASLANKYQLVNKLCNIGVAQEIRSMIGGNDQSFAQIDRDIARSKFRASEQFYEAVYHLLRAMSASVTSDMIPTKKMQAITADFEKMYDFFLKGKDPEDSASLLLDLTGIPPNQSLSVLLRSLPAPWADKCQECGGIIQASHVVSCSCCGGNYHSECCGEKVKVRSRGLSLIRKLWTVHVPDTMLSGPDFRDNVTWTTVNITVDRRVADDGIFPQLGLKLADTEKCSDFYNRLLSGSIELPKLESYKHLQPIGLEQKGCLVTNVSSAARFCGKAAGILIGDVIVGIEFRSFLDPDVETKYLPRQLHSFAKMSYSERMELLSRPATEMRILIERPNVDILKKSIAFMERVRKVNEPMIQALASANLVVRFCRVCLGRQQDEECTLHPIVGEALLARNLIRCLGADCYAVPFHDEIVGKDLDAYYQNMLLDSTSADSCHVSLRRLDGMMTSIIARHSHSAENEAALSVPFNRQPCSKCRNGVRLDWVTDELERKPLELLCQGMRLLVSMPSEVPDENQLHNKIVLACNFVALFSSWCDSLPGASVDSNPKPPLGARCARVPWIREACGICQVRSGEVLRELGDAVPFRVCESPACRDILETELRPHRRDGRHPNCDDSDFPLTSADIFLRAYKENTSYVGATVLVLPSDPILLSVQEKLGLKIEHSGRVVEFIVASYLPDGFHKQKADWGVEANCTDDGGTFHLLPVLSQHQLQFLLHRCKMRKAPRSQAEVGIEWMALDVLNLNGVLCLSPKELRRRLIETSSICASMDGAIALLSKVELDGPTVQEHVIDVLQRGDALAVMPTTPGDAFLEGLEKRHRNDLFEKKFVFPCPPQSADQFGISERLSVSDFFCELIEMLMPCLGHSGREEQDSDRGVTHAVDGTSEAGRAGSDEVVGNQSSELGLIKQPGIVCGTDPSRVDPSSEFVLKYSDLFFRSGDERRKLQEAMQGQDFHKGMRPTHITFQSLALSEWMWTTIVLDREDPLVPITDARQYTGPGWGLELIYWPSVDSTIRVGRVHPYSPASLAGLQMGDVVVSINGLDVRGRHNSVANTMMNLMETHKKSLSVGDLAALFKEPRKAPLNPVVLVVFRRPLEKSSRTTRLAAPRETQTDNVPPTNDGRRGNELNASLTSRNELGTVTFHTYRGNKSDDFTPPMPTNKAKAKNSRPVKETSQAHRVDHLANRAAYGANHSEEEVRMTSQPNIVDHIPSYSSDANRFHLTEGASGTNSSSLPLIDFTASPPFEATNSPALESAAEWDGAWNACAALVLRIFSTVQKSYPLARVLSYRDIYRVSLPRVIFTTSEASLLLESGRRQLPMIGLGFLSSRYDVTIMDWQLKRLAFLDLSSIPRIPDGYWDFLLWKDKETRGPSARVLPIDRLLEGFFRIPHQPSPLNSDQPSPLNSGTTNSAAADFHHRYLNGGTSNGDIPDQIWNNFHSERTHSELRSSFDTQVSNGRHPLVQDHPSSHSGDPPSIFSRGTLSEGVSVVAYDTDIERIRGGGSDKLTEVEQLQNKGRRLYDCAFAEWPNKLVSGVCDLLDGDTNLTAKFIGFVKNLSPDETATSADLVQVSVFHLSSDKVSYYIQQSEEIVSADMLNLVEEGSEEEKIARTWWSNQHADGHDGDCTESFPQNPDEHDATRRPGSSNSLSAVTQSAHPPVEATAAPVVGNPAVLDDHESFRAAPGTPYNFAENTTPTTLEFKESAQLLPKVNTLQSTGVRVPPETAIVAAPSSIHFEKPPKDTPIVEVPSEKSQNGTPIVEVESEVPARAAQIAENLPAMLLNCNRINEDQFEKPPMDAPVIEDQSDEPPKDVAIVENPPEEHPIVENRMPHLNVEERRGLVDVEKRSPTSFEQLSQENHNDSTAVAFGQSVGRFRVAHEGGSDTSCRWVTPKALQPLSDEATTISGESKLFATVFTPRASQIEADKPMLRPPPLHTTHRPSQNKLDSTADLVRATHFAKESATISLKKSLRRISNGTLFPLGAFPDGREVFWLCSDPTGLYVKNFKEPSNEFVLAFHEQSYRQDLREGSATNGNAQQALLPEDGKLCCTWGCMDDSKKDLDTDDGTILCFDAVADLRNHTEQFHSYRDQAESFSFDSKECLWRIPDGEALSKVLADLTKAICSRFPSMLKFTERQHQPNGLELMDKHNVSVVGESPILFRIADIWEYANGDSNLSKAVENILTRLPRSGERLRALVTLWVRIFLLVNDDDKREIVFAEKNDFGLGEFSDAVNKWEGCDSDFQCSRSQMQGSCCKTCSPPLGRFQSWEFKPTTSQKSFNGTGCALFSDLYHAESAPVEDTSLLLNTGLLGRAKILLIRVADNLPDALKCVEENNTTGVGKAGGKQCFEFPLWSEANVEIWRDFVVGAASSRMLAQSLLVLVSSVKNSLLPSWWASAGVGWLSAQNLMFAPSLSKILLRLFVFDAAVAEFVLTAGRTTEDVNSSDNVPACLASLPLEERLVIVAKWADELNLQRFEGLYKNFCCKCDDGGELLCCEFCDTVQHRGCCSPPLQTDPTVFVCSVCTADVAALHESAR